MNFITLIREYTFMQQALLVAFLTSICCGILGTYIVYRKMVFLTSSISHASFAGIGIGIYLHLKYSPIYFAILVSVIFGISLLYIKKNQKIESDTIIGIIMSFGMALGIFFSYLTPGYQKELSSYLFGNILLTRVLDIYLLSILTITVITIFTIYNKPIKYLSFDEKFYQILNVPVNTIDYIMITLVSIAIILNVTTIGIVLIMAILTLPQMIASNLTKSYISIAILSIFISFLAIVVGLYFSYSFNIPTGATIVITMTLVFLVMLIVKRK